MPTDDAADALEPYRKYLTVLAGLHLDRKLRGKLDPADLVQQSLLRAYSAWPELRRREPEVLAAWLRRILAGTLADAVKALGDAATAATSAWSVPWRPTSTAPPRVSPPGSPPTRPPPAAGPSGMRSCYG